VLPDTLRQEVEYLSSSMQFMVLNSPLMPDTLQKLRRAIIQKKTVRFLYRARYPDTQPPEMSLREADPYVLMHIGGAWMLTGYCHLRRDIRHFRLSRIEDLVILDKVFIRPTDFKIDLGGDADRTVVVRALFDHETVPRVLEAPSLYQTAHEDHAEGLLMTFKVRDPNEMLNWLLSWGSHVRVLEPEALRASLAREAEGMLRNHLIQHS
jgi:predicted DNA-binding transcriptional regulator YafY